MKNNERFHRSLLPIHLSQFFSCLEGILMILTRFCGGVKDENTLPYKEERVLSITRVTPNVED